MLENYSKKTLLLLCLLCICFLFPFLGEAMFHTKGEPREAVVALSMLERGNWILPVNNGVDIAYKPPLFHWMIAAVSLLVGTVTEFTARFPSALSLTVMLLAGYVFYARRRGEELAVITTLLTLTNFEVHRAGVNCRVDMLLAAFMVLALYQLYYWYEKDFKGFPLLAVLCLSGAALTKGPVGIALPCLVAFVFALIKGYKLLPMIARFFLVGISSCILPMLWYVAAYQQGGERFLDLVLEENVLRFMGKMSYSSHENPAYYNVITLVAGFIPYTLLVVMSLFVLKYKGLKVRLSGLWSNIPNRIKSMDDARLYSLLCTVIIFVFYCIPKSKRSVYLLPMYPFVAYFLAEYFIYLRNRHNSVVKVFGYTVSVLAFLLIGVYVVLQFIPVPEFLLSGRHPEETRAYIEALQNEPLGVISILLLLFPVFAGIYFVRKTVKMGKVQLLPIFTVIISIFMSLDGFLQPTVLNVKSDKPMAEKIASIVPEGNIYSYRSDFVPGNRMHPFSVNFYVGDRVIPFDEFMPSSGYLIMGEHEFEPFMNKYGSDYKLEEIYNSERRSCDDHSVIKLYRFEKI